MTTCLGKSCSFGLPRLPFVNCGQFMYLVISLLVLRAGCEIWLYQFLIIAYLFTFHLKPHRDRGAKICSNGSGHMTKLAAMLIYGKIMKNSSSLKPKGRWSWKFVCSIKFSSTTKLVQMITLCQISSPMLLYGQKVKTMDFFQKLL